MPGPVQPALPSPQTRERILDVAEALFAARGFAGTSMRDIAGAADLTAASLYNHFEGKEALYAAVLERGIRPLVLLMQGRAAQEEDDDNAAALVGEVMEHLRTRPHLPRLIQLEVLTGGEHLVRLARDWVRPLLEYGVAEMKRERAPFDPDEYPLVIAAWIHLILGHFTMAPIFREALDEDPLAPRLLERQTRFLQKLARLLSSSAPRRAK
ncbi:MAG TPA: TetR family transcriptional regulator [Myxococcota bacterium]|jgi:AcrR family transcriptional regulator|nr:TetR family transcriptional regulator [Myxococcota bacterium]